MFEIQGTKNDIRVIFYHIVKMVQLWISLVNEKFSNSPCENKRILRIFRDAENIFYGDNELDIFITAKKDYSDLSSVFARAINKCGGWARYLKVTDGIASSECNLSQIVSNFGSISESGLRKMFPRKEKGNVTQCIVYRKDGNFYAYACETERFYYVFLFATS